VGAICGGLHPPFLFDILEQGVMMYRINRVTAPTKEEKVAKKIETLLSDYGLDIEAVGKYMATATPHLIYCRAEQMLEAMQYNKEVQQLDRLGYYNDRQ